MRYIILLLFLLGCGIKHKVNGVPNNFKGNIVVDFREASDLCDERYGYRTEASNKCFEEITNFFDSTVSLNLDNIEKYCQNLYTNDAEYLECLQDFTDFLGRLR